MSNILLASMKQPTTARPQNHQMELMQAARAKASFDPRLLTNVIYGGEVEVQRREDILARVERNIREDERELPHVYGELSRTGLYHHGLRVGRAMLEDERIYRHELFRHNDVNYALINASPFGLHIAMFIPTIKLQGDLEQQAYWIPLAESGTIIGTYCQTELGHGTFLRGLETTAHFDQEADEFILHSPTPTSTKYWPGGLGYSTSHAIVIARLITQGRDYGVHAFLVQLRSLEDWEPLPGIELGDIGLKMGLNSTDNGYAVFHRVRIPRRNMMMGHAKVARDGTYTPPAADHSKHSYSTMIYTRCAIVSAVAFQLAQATTVAIRYSTVREQGNLGFDTNSSNDIPIMIFKSQHYRLLTILARAYAILFASKESISLHEDLVREQKSGRNTKLAYSHATSAGLKAYASQVAADGAEDARKCCGGHGYLALSGLPDIVGNVSSVPTLEGENYVMYQQTARYLVKQARAVRDGGITSAMSIDYLRAGFNDSMAGRDTRCPHSGIDFLGHSALLTMFRHRSVRSIFDCEAALRSAEQAGCTPEQAWNRYMIDLIMAARYHLEYFILEAFVQHISRIQDHKVRRVMEHVCNLYALSTIESPLVIGSSGFLEDGYISARQLRSIRGHVNDTLNILLPEAIGLTDAWNFSDAGLRSALGRKDGNVYEVLLEWTRQLPINRQSAVTGGVEQVGFESHIRPMLARSKL